MKKRKAIYPLQSTMKKQMKPCRFKESSFTAVQVVALLSTHPRWQTAPGALMWSLCSGSCRPGGHRSQCPGETRTTQLKAPTENRGEEKKNKELKGRRNNIQFYISTKHVLEKKMCWSRRFGRWKCVLFEINVGIVGHYDNLIKIPGCTFYFYIYFLLLFI